MGNPKVIYKPTVENNILLNPKITYYNRKEGRRVSFSVGSGSAIGKAILELPKQIANLVSREKPNIDPDQLLDAYYSNIKVTTSSMYGGRTADVYAVTQFLERLVNKYRQPEPISEGGNMITPNEQYDMMKQWHQWFGDE